MKARFAGRVALVTGASSGIGLATARQLAREGAKVVNLDVRPPAEEERDAEILTVLGDVREHTDCQRAVAVAVAEGGRLDLLFCNAGVFEGGTVESQTLEAWDQQVDVMLKGTFLSCKAAVPALRASGGGSIVLSGSNCSHIGCSGRFAYTAVKAAMPVLAKQLSNDYYHSAGIRANCVSPGYVETEMTTEIWRNQSGSGADELPPENVVSRWQRAESIASVVTFLMSDEAADVTGVTVPVSRTALLRVAGMRLGG
ncbi:SDR family oxidoreductase [Nocardioides sp. SYSU D00038]|uniref:SDR family NAD(P)-dependent oxidoreductase n=1 Tax=Nocardioides sp. SYSU D00038 TaxID=2812554 RepID=UPI0027DD7CD8|nr:SDR family oxidoreductase [Nocardioides sp. SYSU D00038]